MSIATSGAWLSSTPPPTSRSISPASTGSTTASSTGVLMATNHGPDFIEQLQAAAQEAREVLAELRSEQREARALERRIQELRGEVSRMVESTTAEFVAEAFREVIPKLKTDLADICHKALDKYTTAMEREMRALQRLFNRGEKGATIRYDELAKDIEAGRVSLPPRPPGAKRPFKLPPPSTP